MIFIAHRANLNGPNPEKENHPDYINKALKNGFDVEIDVWLLDDKFYLGHDEPKYEIDFKFLLNDKFWIHTKTIETLIKLNRKNGLLINCFYHNKDDCTLTSGGYIWTFPRKLPLSNIQSIAVLPELVPDWDISKAAGICSDYVKAYKNDLNFKI